MFPSQLSHKYKNFSRQHTRAPCSHCCCCLGLRMLSPAHICQLQWSVEWKFIIHPNSCRHDLFLLLAPFFLFVSVSVSVTVFIAGCCAGIWEHLRLRLRPLTAQRSSTQLRFSANAASGVFGPPSQPSFQASLWRLLITLTYICIAFTRVLTLITCPSKRTQPQQRLQGLPLPWPSS